MSGSGNIWCIFGAEELGCTINEPLGGYSLGQSGLAKTANFEDGPPGSMPVTLSYGQPVSMYGYTCLAQEIGLSCWNNDSGHGLFLSRAQSVLW